MTTAPAPTPSGLTADEILDLAAGDQRRLGVWHAAVAGDNDGRLWWPAAIRRLPLETRMVLATDDAADLAWQRLERERVEADVVYFVEGYGHVTAGKGGEPIPFALWPEQREVLVLFIDGHRVIVLKARQLGLTWLALHYAVHRMNLDPLTPRWRTLALSKTLDDAKKLLARVRRINDLLPPYLRTVEDVETRGSMTNLHYLERGSLVSLPGSPHAARSETADLAIADEFAFVKNGEADETFAALEPTLGEAGELIIVSTGNGGPDVAGDGQQFAQLVTKALAGESEFRGVFLPSSTHPARTEDWRERRRVNYTDQRLFAREYPETVDEALEGEADVHVYPPAAIAAAKQLGQLLADSPLYVQLVDQGVEVGIDWGDFQTFAVYAVPLPGLGFYVIDELVQMHVEPGQASDAMLEHAPGGAPEARLVRVAADSAPAGTNATFTSRLVAKWRANRWRYPAEHTTVPFSKYKEGGGERYGINTAAFLRSRFLASELALEAGTEPARLTGVAAIHPRCTTLLAQLPNVRRDPDTGKIIKPPLDPRNPERGDHGPDAVIALEAQPAEAWTANLVPPEEA